jgi:hypothetical protein
MIKKVLLLAFVFVAHVGMAQVPNWQSFTDSIQSLSSPRSCDLNNDGVLDIVVGAGLDGIAHPNGIIAVNGATGSLLWKRPARNEVFGSAQFYDITSDGIKDVFITGRQAQLLAINGSNGDLIWDYFPYGTNPIDSGLYNFYNPQFIADVSGDLIPDILVSNGGDHAAPAWQTNRPPGHLMVVNGVTGGLIAKAVVPDSAETYCSPIVVDVQGNGTKWILFGTGGENLGGHFYACPLSDLVQSNSLSNSIVLATDNTKGFIAPASVAKANSAYSIFIQSFGGTVTKINGFNWSAAWSTTIPGTESSAAPVLGKMNGDLATDAFVLLYKGIAPSYTDFYQVMLDGNTGAISFKDSLGVFSYPSANAVDLNNDGIDEVVVSVTYSENSAYKHKLHAIDFQTATVSQLDVTRAGVNLGCTPLIVNMDSDPSLELIYIVKRDSLNPVGSKGIYINCYNLSSTTPNNGIAWGSYMGTKHDGHYIYTPQNCGFGSTISQVNYLNPSCNNLADGSISPIVSGTFPPYTFLWSTGEVTPTISGLAAGNYWVRVTDANNCYEERSFNLVDPYVISFGGIAPPTCPGGNNGMATLNSSGCYCMFSTCTFLWENGITTKPNNALVEGWNSVIINHPGGCTVIDSVFIPSPSPVIDYMTVVDVDCFGNSTGMIELFSSQPAGTVSYNWSNGTQNSSVTGLAAGVYSVNVTDARPCQDSLVITIDQPDSLNLQLQSSNVTCHGDSTGTINWITQGGTAPYSYALNNQSILNSSASGLSSGNYTIDVTDAMNCSQSAQVNITEPSPLSVSFSSQPASGMGSFDGIITATPSGGTTPYTYNWSLPQTDSMIVYLNPGMYQLELVDGNGCTLDTSIYLGALELATNSITQLLVSPNPTSNILTIQVPESLLHHTFCIRDIDGRLVHRGQFTEVSEKLQMADYAKGMYVLHVPSTNQQIRLVKE